MSLENLYILDVGHGNCSLIVGEAGVAIVDAPKGPTLSDALEQLKIDTVAHIYVSHADADHIVGISTLLLNKSIKVENVYVNPDGQKQTEAWKQFRMALTEACKKGTKVNGAQNTIPDAVIGKTHISIIAPDVNDYLAGVGGFDSKDKKITSNSHSVVIKVMYEDKPRALLAGDIEAPSLEKLLEDKHDLTASILVFPHHGGLPGPGDPKDFSDKLCKVVKPSLVVFSNSRVGKFENPRPDILEGLSNNTVRVACTQLSKACLATVDSLTFEHLSDVPSKGRINNSSCAGSMVFDLANFDLSTLDSHSEFVSKISEPLCKNCNFKAKTA